MKELEIGKLEEFLIGKPVKNISRVFYVANGDPEDEFGLLQISNPVGTILFRVNTDGESVEVQYDEYYKLYPDYENDPAMQPYGYYKVFDVSSQMPYKNLIDKKPERLSFMKFMGKIATIVLEFETTGLIEFHVEGDECFVRVTLY